MARNTLIALPAILVVILPVMYLVMIYFIPADQMNGVDKMMQLLPAEAKDFTVQQSMFYLLTNLLCPMFFNDTADGLHCFRGVQLCRGKERSTIETLLLTPLSIKQIFRAKVLGCIILSAISTAISFVIFTIVISTGDILWECRFSLTELACACTAFGAGNNCFRCHLYGDGFR